MLNQNNNEFGVLDSLNLISLFAQIQNMQDDAKETNYIHEVIKVIAIEIEKLHKENDDIIRQNEEILSLLKRKN